MSETPQSNDADLEITEQPVERNDSVVESDTTTPVEGESEQQVDEVEVAKQKANDAFNKQYGEKKQLERDLAVANEFRAKTEQAERERQQAAIGNIPPIPDEFDDNFTELMAKRDEAIQAQATYNANNQAYMQQQQVNQQQAAQVQQVKIQESMVTYSNKALELGIKQEELQAAGNAVASYGLSDDLVMHILADNDGPLITKHLAANPQDGYQLASMSPYSVGQFLDTIKTKASALKPKTSSTPAPATNLQGNGVDPEAGKYSHIKGAKFE